MNDTTPEMERKFREMLMARSGAERMIMGASMFDSARRIVLASLPKDLPDDDLKRRLFERTYGATIEEVIQTVRDAAEN